MKVSFYKIKGKCIVNLLDTGTRVCICNNGFTGRNCEINVTKNEADSQIKLIDEYQLVPQKEVENDIKKVTGTTLAPNVVIEEIGDLTKKKNGSYGAHIKEKKTFPWQILVAVIGVILLAACVAIFFIIRSSKVYERKMLYIDAINDNN